MVALLILQTWGVEGLVPPSQIVSGSMAPTLLGLHREVICSDCGYRFVCGSDLKPVGVRAVCPLCGHAQAGLDQLPDVPGDRVLIAKSIFDFRRPQRWEVVAFRHPTETGQILVKRVVGLPGESIRIRHGDVYANGEIQRKTLAQQRALAILVDDADYRPVIEPVPPDRWQGESKDSLWGSSQGRFARRATSDEEPADDWLVYRHWYRGTGQNGEVREGPITDVCGYNQSEPRRWEDFHEVSDLMLAFRLVETFGRGELTIRASDGRDEFQVRILPGKGRFAVQKNGRSIPAGAGELPPLDGDTMVEVSLFDRQFVLAFDGRPAFPAWPYDPSDRPVEHTSSPLAIGSRGGLGVVVRDLRVYRDVYYTHPIGPEGRWGLDSGYELADDEYFVLGDNSPVSRDSRIWPAGPAVGAKLLVGKLLVVHFPSRRIRLGPWELPVPDPTRIRYIR
ncbi:MAG TPA: signal peptidase I [Thermoguttaceae bacterium]|nr:signal peptidase I [Thermoguttaceae bacterium]